jgi:hypothetical protein
MNRRQFLIRALAAVPAIAVAPALAEELLELLAPRRTIILPPAGGWVTYGSWDELAAITRKAFVPRMITEIYRSSPLIEAMLRNAGADVRSIQIS